MRHLYRVATLFATLSITPALASAQTVFLHAARMLNVRTGQIESPAALVISGDRIQAVRAEAPADAKVIELGDVTLLPGLTDMHVHLTGDLEGDWVHRDVTETAVDAALRGVVNARKTLLAGFTTVRNVGAPGGSDVSLMHAIDEGWVIGPRIVPARSAIGITGGHCDVTGYAPGIAQLGPEDGVADGIDQALKAVRYQIKYGAKVIKICATAGVLSFEGPVGAQQLSEDEMRAIVQEAARHGLKVAAHAHGTEGILAAVRAGVASIEHGSMLSDEAIALMKQRGTYLVPTAYLLTVVDPAKMPPAIKAKMEQIIPLAQESHRKAIRAGVKVAFGTDAAVYPHGDNAKEFAVLVGYGMKPIDAIRTATLNAADLLGVTDRGEIAAGKLADLIAVPGNPLNDVHVLEQVRFVMKGGVVVKQE